MKIIIKNNIKIIIAFILGVFISGIGATALTLSFASGDVEHTKSDGTKTNVKAAINDLYSKATAGDATSAQILSGKKALSKGTLLTGTMTNYSSSTAQSCTTANTSNKLYVKPANAGYYTANSSFNTNINYNPNKTVATSTSAAAATANGNTTATTINLDSDRKVTIPAGYYSAATTIQNVAKSGSTYIKQMANSLYSNNMSSSNNTLFNINCSAGYGGSTTHNSDGGGGIWSRDWYDYSKSVTIPLYKYDSNGNITEVLNVIIVTATAKVSGTFWGGSGSSSTTSYSMKTNKGTTIQSTKSVGASNDTSTNTVPTTYNLFGISGLSGAESITLSGSGSVSAAINGASRGDFDVGQSADSSITYNLQYIKIQ